MNNRRVQTRDYCNPWIAISWLVLAGLFVFFASHFLLALKTGRSVLHLADSLNWQLPGWMLSSRWTVFILSGRMFSESSPWYSFDTVVLALFTACLFLITFGTALLCRSSDFTRVPASVISPWVLALGAALLSSGLVAAHLEVCGLWTRISLPPNPAREQGVPGWLWWACTALAFVVWWKWARAFRPSPAGTGQSAFRVSALASAGLVLAVIAVLLHASRPPVMRGISPRMRNDEFGTYYGIVAGIAVVVLSLGQLGFLLLRACSAPRVRGDAVARSAQGRSNPAPNELSKVGGVDSSPPR